MFFSEHSVYIILLYIILLLYKVSITQQCDQRIRGFLIVMRYINPRFTYLLTYNTAARFVGMGEDE